MANDAKRISQLSQTNAIHDIDRLVVLTRPLTAGNVQTISLTNFTTSLVDVFPIASPSSVGIIKIGTGLSVDSNNSVGVTNIDGGNSSTIFA
jgi:hypothetical protein